MRLGHWLFNDQLFVGSFALDPSEMLPKFSNTKGSLRYHIYQVIPQVKNQTNFHTAFLTNILKF